MLYKNRACSPSAPPGLFYKRNHVKIAICKHYLGICFITEWLCRISVLLPQLALNASVWCGTMATYCLGVCQLLSVHLWRVWAPGIKQLDLILYGHSRISVVSDTFLVSCCLSAFILLSEWPSYFIRLWGLQVTVWELSILLAFM